MDYFFADTNVIRSNIDTMNSYQKYYETKKNSFLPGYFGSGSTPVSTYLGKINKNYATIANNSKNISTFLEQYVNDIESIERILSNTGGGSLFDASTNASVRKYSNSLKKYTIDKENLFLVLSTTLTIPTLETIPTTITVDENVASANEMFKIDEIFHDVKQKNLEQVEKTDFEILVSQYEMNYQKEIDEFNGMVENIDVELKDLLKAQKKLERTNGLYENFKTQVETNALEIVGGYKNFSCSDEKLKELGITRTQLQNLSVDDLLKICIERDSSIKQQYQTIGEYEQELNSEVQKLTQFQTYQEYADYVTTLQNDKAYLEAAIKKDTELKNCVLYNLLPSSEDYQNYSYESIDVGKISVFDVDKMDLSPLEKFKVLNQYFSRYQIRLDHLKELENLARASEASPELEKMYNYLYDTKGEKEATKYLLAISNTVNQVNAYQSAQKFVNSLKDEKEAKKLLEEQISKDDTSLLGSLSSILLSNNYATTVVENHVKTAGKGVIDGLDSFYNGLVGWFNSSENYTESEYETMYILQALQQDEKYNFLLDNNYEISQSIGNMLPSVALSIVLTPAVGTVSLGVSAGGNSYHSARVEGYDTGRSVLYGVLSGVSEVTLEKYLGAIPGLSEVSVTGLKTFAQAMAKEGIEEGTQEYVDALLRYGVFNEEIDLTEVSKNAEKSAIYGAIIGGVFNGPSLATNLHANVNLDENSALNHAEQINQVGDLKYNKFSMLQSARLTLESNLKKYVYKNTNNFKGVNDKIKQNGLYHFTNAADSIIENGYIKPSGINASYGNPKTFFFSGIPEVGAFATNLDYLPLTATAVKVMPTSDVVESSKLKIRSLDDQAISYDGKFDLSNQTVSKEYFILTKENNELVYKNVSQEVYDNYENTMQAKQIEEYIKDKNNIRAIKDDYLNTLFSSEGNLEKINSSKNKVEEINLKELLQQENETSEKIQFTKTFDENMTYSGYDYLYKSEHNLESIVDAINSKNDHVSKYLIEVSNIEELNHDIVSKIPDNVEVRVIGGYTAEYMNGMKSPNGTTSRQHSTYTTQELQQILTEVDKFDANINPNWNDYEKAYYAYEYLKNNISYNPDPGRTNMRGKEFDGLMGLVNKESTCIGYAFIYKELLNRMGIDCTIIGGSLNGEGQHAYTVVNIGQDTFLVDPVREFLNITPDEKGFGATDSNIYIFKNNKNLKDQINIDNDALQSKVNMDSIDELFVSNEVNALLEKFGNLENADQERNFVLEITNNEKVDSKTRQEFIKYLIKTEQINNFSNGSIVNLMSLDENLLHLLVHTDKFKQVIQKKLKQDPKTFRHLLTKLTESEFHTLFNSTELQSYFEEMSNEEFLNVVEFLQDNRYAFLNKTILNKISNMDSDTFFQFLEEYSWNFDLCISKAIKENFELKDYLNFLDQVQQKYLLTENTDKYVNELPLKDLYNRFLNNSNKMQVPENVQNFSKVMDQIKNDYFHKIQSNSSVVLEIKDDSCFFPVEKEGWYTIEIEANGETEYYQKQTTRDDILELYSSSTGIILDDATLTEELINGDAQIKSINWDERKNKLYFENVESGNYRVSIMLDGQLETMLVSSENGFLDLSEYVPNKAIIDDVKLTKMESYNQIVLDDGGIYKFSGISGGKRVTHYIASNRAGLIDVDSIIVQNNLYDIEDVMITRVDLKDIDVTKFDINKYSAGSDLFDEQGYGGNQSDIVFLLNNKSPNHLEKLKIENLKNIMKKYYPNISDMEMIIVATSYANVGCVYMAFSNALATYFGSIENGANIFKERFGYDLYFEENGKKSYNVNGIALDLFLNRYQNLSVTNISRNAEGIDSFHENTILANFLKDKNIDFVAKSKNIKTTANYNNLISNLLEKQGDNTFYIFLGSNYDMEYISGNNNIATFDHALENSSTDESHNCYNVGGHGVLITGITKEGDLIVSSWSKKYKISKEDFEIYKDRSGRIKAFSFVINE